MLSNPWDISPKEAVRLQRELAGRVRAEPVSGPVRTVAGADCAFLGERHGRQQAPRGDIIAAAVLCDVESMAVLATAHVVRPCTFPYVPGLLSFREAPSVIAAVEKLPERPGLLMCDGQGVAHPRRLGLASHVGLWLNLRTIGVAKSRLCGEPREPGVSRGSRTDLVHRGEIIGAIVRTRTRVRPLFVSVGHLVTLEDAVHWTLRCARRYRLPEPTRQAHLHVTRLKAALPTPDGI